MEWGGIFLVLAVISYNTPLLLLPFFIPLLYLTRTKSKLNNYLRFGLLLGIFVIVVGYLLPLLNQKSGITIFTDETTWSNWIEWRYSMWQPLLPFLGNKWIYYSLVIFRNFFNSFFPQFLVIGGGTHPWHQLPGWSHITYLLYLLGIWGVVTSFFDIKKLEKPDRANHFRWSILITFFFSLAPSIVTVDSPHATRSLLFIFIWLLMAGIGFDDLLQRIKKSKFKKYATSFLTFLLLVNLIYFIFYIRSYFSNDYFSYQNYSFKSGFEKIVTEIDKKYPDEEVAVVDPTGYQYILLAWYEKTQPDLYLNSNVRQLPDTIGMQYGEKVGRYHFIANKKDVSPEETVLVNWNEEKGIWEVEQR